MMGHNICFYGRIRKIIPKSSLLLLAGLPWSGKNIWKMNIFLQVREKSGNFVDGNLERN